MTSLFTLLVLVGIGYFLIQYFSQGDVVFSLKKEAVGGAYAAINNCSKDDDCMLSDIKPYCGCFYLINKHVPADDLVRAEEDYRRSGEKCEPQIQCQEPPETGQIRCISGKCSSIRPTLDPSKVHSSDPKVLEQQIKNALSNANYCAADDNCIVADIDAGCPFGCYNLVSANADLSWIKAGIDKYNKIGANKCIYDCDRAPSTKEIKCVKNKCVDVRYP